MTVPVALVPCAHYETRALEKALDFVEEALGPLERGAEETDRVLLKPNLLTASAPEDAVVTHPALVAGVARRLRARGYEVFIGDSPGGAVKGVESYWERTGLLEAARESGAHLLNFEGSGWERVRRGGRAYTLARPVLEFRFILNLPKLKTHSFAGLTGAVKNLYGSVPGLMKTSLHLAAPGPDDFAARLLDVYEVATPTFHLADGVVAMDGRGPSAGRARPMGCLLAGRDGSALDLLFARLVGCRPERVITLAEARRRGWTGADWKAVEVRGADPGTLAPRDFRLPDNRIYRWLPPFLGPLVRRLVRSWPESTERCTGCGFCAESCPAEAIRLQGGRAVVDRTRCISCLCCHELCPEKAVAIQRTWMARRIFPR